MRERCRSTVLLLPKRSPMFSPRMAEITEILFILRITINENPTISKIIRITEAMPAIMISSADGNMLSAENTERT